MGRLVARVEERFRHDDDAASSLARVEGRPVSATVVRELGDHIDRWVRDDPRFGPELELLVRKARLQEARGDSMRQTASGEGIVQIGQADGSEIDIRFAPQGRPERAS